MQRGNGTPYQQLGMRLSAIRHNLQETIHEVSGAVELDSDILARFERGEDRPSEDVLDMLISHFNVKDDEADELWDLAGYNSKQAYEEPPIIPNLMVVPTDNRIIYSDTANITINNFGVVMNFMQNGLQNQPVAIARVGMSLEHAKSVLEVLSATIAKAEAAKTPKQLPRTTKTPTRKKSK